MKKCSKCGIEKEENEFSKDKNRKDGLFPVCKQCTSEYKKKLYTHKKELYKPEEIKTCSTCGFVGESKSFVKTTNQCLKCCNERKRKGYQENKEELKNIRKIKKNQYDPNKIKTCRVCGFSGPSKLFRYGQNLCKKCSSESTKKKHKECDMNIIKTCRECGFVGTGDKFVKMANWCLECKRRDTRKRYKEEKQKHLERIENNTPITKVCYVCGFVGSEDQFMVKANLCKKCDHERLRKDYAENTELWRKRYKEYVQTPAGKVSRNNAENKRRRQLGHDPINKWFDGCEGHHLRYSKSSKDQDNDLLIYVPSELHKSIWHNGTTGQGMREINILLLEWYFSVTPEEERNPKAVKLYWNYCTLPEPEWSSNACPTSEHSSL